MSQIFINDFAWERKRQKTKAPLDLQWEILGTEYLTPFSYKQEEIRTFH